MFWEDINVKLQGSGIELTDAIVDYVVKRVTNLGKLLKKVHQAGGDVIVFFDVGKTTEHHRQGQIFKAECSITIDGKQYYATYNDENLYAAIDGVKDIIFRDIKKDRDKQQTIYKRGAAKLKELARSVKFWK